MVCLDIFKGYELNTERVHKPRTNERKLVRTGMHILEETLSLAKTIFKLYSSVCFLGQVLGR